MAAHFWKAVVAAALLQVAFSPAYSAPQGISVYSSIDEKGQQHTSVVPLNQQQSQALAQQHLAQLNQQQSAIGSLFGGNILGSILGLAAQAQHAQQAQHYVAPVKQQKVVAAPPPPPPPVPASGKTPCAGCGVA